MKSNLIIILCLYLFTSCSNNQKISSNKDSNSNNGTPSDQTVRLCFQHVEGAQNKDTSSISMILNNDQVSGSFNHIPYEKDSRKGTITGTRNGDTIKAIWSFMQEGTNDTISVEFKLSENELLQKTFGIDETTGRQKLTDTSTFSIRYKKIDCGDLQIN